ncbi:hypothetical protein HJC23_006702 [Cyclotella cryptica]|uniref:Uncharacterized protein n=1 Tax=Cyclotella cryptica TaxID=29204 RepID=A0ABD3R7C3_9STRA|eukprot:CCRYP_001142-RA/>CCRYP_001142-RA protein AED:0.14 eAED:0.14 QI:0/-1/0/1/-1/1/1/0/319
MKTGAARRAVLVAIVCPPLAESLQTGSSTRCAQRRSHRPFPTTTITPHTIDARIAEYPVLVHSKSNRSSEELGRRERKKRLEQIQKQRRRNRWVKRYGTVEALKETFGAGPPWGDLSPTQTRALYHTLLPRSLLALNEMGLVEAEDLAPLAYEARIAAKEYARSRCVWTGRVGVFLFDQYRSLRDRGRLIKPGDSSSMSWEEIWAKYEGQIIKEQLEKGKKLDEDELMMQTYMRILERSCSTNQAFDSLFLKEDRGDNINLTTISSQLESDVRAILLSPSDVSKAEKKLKKLEKQRRKEQEKEAKLKTKADKKKNKHAM